MEHWKGRKPTGAGGYRIGADRFVERHHSGYFKRDQRDKSVHLVRNAGNQNGRKMNTFWVTIRGRVDMS